jgi:hypothetical protein
VSWQVRHLTEARDLWAEVVERLREKEKKGESLRDSICDVLVQLLEENVDGNLALIKVRDGVRRSHEINVLITLFINGWMRYAFAMGLVRSASDADKFFAPLYSDTFVLVHTHIFQRLSVPGRAAANRASAPAGADGQQPRQSVRKRKQPAWMAAGATPGELVESGVCSRRGLDPVELVRLEADERAAAEQAEADMAADEEEMAADDDDELAADDDDEWAPGADTRARQTNAAVNNADLIASLTTYFKEEFSPKVLKDQLLPSRDGLSNIFSVSLGSLTANANTHVQERLEQLVTSRFSRIFARPRAKWNEQEGDGSAQAPGASGSRGRVPSQQQATGGWQLPDGLGSTCRGRARMARLGRGQRRLPANAWTGGHRQGQRVSPAVAVLVGAGGPAGRDYRDRLVRPGLLCAAASPRAIRRWECGRRSGGACAGGGRGRGWGRGSGRGSGGGSG